MPDRRVGATVRSRSMLRRSRLACLFMLSFTVSGAFEQASSAPLIISPIATLKLDASSVLVAARKNFRGGFARGGFRGGFSGRRAGGFAGRVGRPGFAGGGVQRRGIAGGYGPRPGWHGGGVRRGGVVVRRNVVIGGVYRPSGAWWRPGAAIAAGAAIGFVGAATAAAWAGTPPAPGYCWFYTNSSRTKGFWDRCPA